VEALGKLTMVILVVNGEPTTLFMRGGNGENLMVIKSDG
jgi:hypothetical protein